MTTVLKVEHLTKQYGDKVAVSNLNLDVKEGEIIGLLGSNGAGKSTSIECILGTKKMEEGKVSILSMDPVKDRKKIYAKVGVQFQESNYQTGIRVDELCEETAAFYKDPADVMELLKKFGLEDKTKQPVASLSGGERQRLFIVLSLLNHPKLVFLDELTTGLDTKARRDVWKALEKLKKEGLTIVLTSHFMDEVEVLCDCIIILKKGETVFSGTTQEAKEESKCDSFEDAYLALSDNEEKEEEE